MLKEYRSKAAGQRHSYGSESRGTPLGWGNLKAPKPELGPGLLHY